MDHLENLLFPSAVRGRHIKVSLLAVGFVSLGFHCIEKWELLRKMGTDGNQICKNQIDSEFLRSRYSYQLFEIKILTDPAPVKIVEIA